MCSLGFCSRHYDILVHLSNSFIQFGNCCWGGSKNFFSKGLQTFLGIGPIFYRDGGAVGADTFFLYKRPTGLNDHMSNGNSIYTDIYTSTAPSYNYGIGKQH